MRTKEKLVILLEALEVENIDKLIVCGTDTFEALGKEIAKRTKQLKAKLSDRDKVIKEAIKALSLNEKETDDVTYHSKDEYALSILEQALEKAELETIGTIHDNPDLIK